MGPYSTDLRERVIAAYVVGDGSIRELAKRFNLVKGTIENWLRLWRQTGGVAPRAHGGGVPATISGSVLEALRELVQKNADATAEELHQQLQTRCAIKTSRSAVSRALLQEKLTVKRRRSTRKNRIAPMSSQTGTHSA